MSFGGGTRFNSQPRGGKRKERRMEEGGGDNWRNQDQHEAEDGEGDPRPVKAPPGRRPFPPRNVPEAVIAPRVRRVEVRADEPDYDLLAGARLIVTGAETLRAVEEATGFTLSEKDTN